MTIPYPIDPSLPSNPTPLFSDATAVRGDHMRSNNEQIWSNTLYIVNMILGGAVLSTDGTMAGNSDVLFPSEKAIRTYIESVINAHLPIGSEMYWPGVTPPANWLVRDGSSLLKTSYPSLWAALAPVASDLAMTPASPCVFTLVNHGLQTYQCVSLETTGGFYEGFSANTNYYVHVIDVHSFHLCTSIANVTAGIYKNASGSQQSGVHSLRYSSYGLGTTGYFKLPDDRGIHIVGTGIQGTAPGWSGSLSKHIGVQGYYDEDKIQNITGAARVHFDMGILAYSLVHSGAFGPGSSRGSIPVGTSGTGYDLNFDASRVARTGTITNPARLGHLPIIKYQ